MLKLIKYFKPFVLSILAIIIFLFVQALCDLSLPEYTSNIVNVGIQQKGIENAVPKVIRKTEFEKLMLFINEKDRKKVSSSYKVLAKNELSNKDFKNYVEDYPQLKKETICKLKNISSAKKDKLNSIIGKAILIVSGIEKNGLQGISGNEVKNQKLAPPVNSRPVGNSIETVAAKKVDPFEILSKLPQEKIDEIKRGIDSKFSNMPDSIIKQGAISYIHDEYKKIGLDVDGIQTNYILKTGGLMLLLALLSMAATIVVGYIGAKVASKLSRNLRRSVFRKVAGFSNSEFDQFSTASLITRSTNDIQQIQMLSVMFLRVVFYAPLIGIGGVIKVLNSDSSMVWTIVVAVVAMLVLIAGLFSVAIPKFKSVQKLVDKLNLVTREILSGVLVIRAFNTQKHQEEKFDAANGDLTRTNLFVSRIMAIMMPAMMLIMNGITLLIVLVGAHRVNSGAMQVGDMMAYIQYAMQIIMAFLMISMMSIMLPRAAVSAERIGEVLDADNSISDPKTAEKFINNKKGYVEFKNVSFKYPGAEDDAIADISFVAKPGETTAFIGSTGSGKTTLVNLIPRFYDVSGGEILIDGVDVRKVKQHDLRERIGYVSQKAVLFSGTIESNIKYGAGGASIGEIQAAATTAQAMEFISLKPEGLMTDIAQGGANVSGGQKQRLSIARALAKKAEINIFDDSFSALDLKTDFMLRKALKQDTKDSTVLIVAQRISTIMNADQIIVLEEGRIAGKGTHNELMKNCEVYRQIAMSQLSKEELANE